MTYAQHLREFQVITVDQRGQITERRAGQIETWAEDLGGGVSLELAALPGGAFNMGSPRGQGSPDEQPQHRVSVAPFLAGLHLVTQAQWVQVMRSRPPCRFRGPQLPVENVSWWEAGTFCERLARRTGRRYRLPSEAQWEYACRAGTATPFHCGETITAELANYCGEHVFREEPPGPYRHTTTPVGSFAPNGFGLFDLHGNLWEWCLDHWHADYAGAPGDGQAWTAPAETGFRVVRGGSWHEVPEACRSAARAKFSPGQGDDLVGFRVVAAWT